MIDTKRFIAEVAAKNGIRIDSDDPALCLMTLNELVLEETVRKAVEDIRVANREFEKAAEQLQVRAGSILAEKITGALAEARSEFAHSVDEASAKALEKLNRLHQFHSRLAVHWLAAGLLSALVILGFGVLLGMTLR